MSETEEWNIIRMIEMSTLFIDAFVRDGFGTEKLAKIFLDGIMGKAKSETEVWLALNGHNRPTQET